MSNNVPLRDDNCSVCGEHGSKYHYGILTCDGCKAFFRRTVRLNLQYDCRHARNCDIESGKRNVCRFCRYQKCLQSGMRIEAVQKPRDPISKRRAPSCSDSGIATPSTKSEVEEHPTSTSSVMEVLPSPNSATSSSTSEVQRMETAEELLRKMMHDDSLFSRLSSSELATFVSRNFVAFIAALRQLDDHCREHFRRSRQISRSLQPTSLNDFGFSLATLEDCHRCLREEMIAKIQLTKSFRSFQAMPLKDKVALCRANAVEGHILSAVKRSMPFEAFILLYDERHVVTRDSLQSMSKVPGLISITTTLLDDIIAPIRRMEIDSTEMSCMRGISFWNPEVCSDEVKEVIRKRQLCLLVLLENYVNAKPLKVPGRYGTLLMLLKTIQSVGQKVKEKIRMSQIFDLYPSDDLIDDIFKDPADAWGPLGEHLSFRPTTITAAANSAFTSTASGEGPKYLGMAGIPLGQTFDPNAPLFAELQPAATGYSQYDPQGESVADWTLWNYL